MLITKELINNIYYIKLYNINNNDFNNYINYVDEVYSKYSKLSNQFKIIFDLTNICIYDSVYCKDQLDYMITNKYNTIKNIEKTAIIVSNSIIKNLLNLLIFNIIKPIKPNIITNTLEEALLFIN